MIVQRFNLNIIPSQSPVIVHVNQYDTGVGRLVAALYEDNSPYAPTGTAVIQGTKPDGKGFQYAASLNGNLVTANLTDQMSVVAGDVRAQIVVTEESGITGTFAFIMRVQRSALPSDADMSESDYQAIETLIEEVQEATQIAQEAIAETQENAEDAEAWAQGTRSGVPVESTDPTYEHNAEYWAQYAKRHAEAGISVCITQNLTKAQWDSHNIGDEDTWLDTVTERRGTRINDIFIVTGTATDSLDAYFLIYRSTTADGDLQGILLSKSIAYRGATGITPSITMNASVLPTGGIPDVAIDKSGTDAAPVFNLTFSGLKGEQGAMGIPGRDGDPGNGIAGIVKTGTSGLVDTYTITMTNGDTATFTVTNGENGHTILNSSGTSMPQRSNLQFSGGLTTSDDSTNGKTVVSDGVWTTPVSCLVGDTTCTITNSAIHTTSTIKAYSETSSGTPVGYEKIVVTEGQAVITFASALTEAANIKLNVLNV